MAVSYKRSHVQLKACVALLVIFLFIEIITGMDGRLFVYLLLNRLLSLLLFNTFHCSLRRFLAFFLCALTFLFCRFNYVHGINCV